MDNTKRMAARDLLKAAVAARTSSLPQLRPIGEPGPLSYAQERLWFLDRLVGSVAYNMPMGLRLAGPTDAAAIDRSLCALVARHAVLRTFIKDEGGEQAILPVPNRLLVEHDLTDLPPERQAETLGRLDSEDAARPFDLTSEYRLRATLVRLRPDDCVLLITTHHIACDAWSIGILLEEMLNLYAANGDPGAASLSGLPVQFGDYAAWQRERGNRGMFDRSLDYWGRVLRGAPHFLPLPLDRPRPAAQSFKGEVSVFNIAPDLVGQLKELGRGRGATLFMVVTTAFQLLLSRYSGQKDLLVGAAFANRPEAELERLIGFFANALPLRLTIDTASTVADLIDQVRQRTLEAAEHQDTPFERIVEAMQPERSLSHQPLIQACIAFHNVPFVWPAGSASQISILPRRLQVSRFDLTLYCEEQPDGSLAARFEYASDLFDRERIERMAGHLRVLMEGMVAHPERSAQTLPVLTPAEVQEVVYDWNRTERPVLRERCLQDLLTASASAHPDKIAVIKGDESLSYGELDRRSEAWSHLLRARGIGRGDRVAVCLERSLDLIVAIFAALKAGAAYVPLDAGHPPMRLAELLQDAAAAALVTRGASARSFTGYPGQIVTTEDLDAAGSIVAGEGAPTSDPQDTAYIIYTSGSTGKPKGVMISHESALNTIFDVNSRFEVGPSDRTYMVSSIGFDLSVYDIFGAFAAGGAVVIPSHDLPDPHAQLEDIRAAGVTVWNSVPQSFDLLVAACEQSSHTDLADLRLVLLSGDWLPLDLPDRARQLRADLSLHSLGGATEGSIWSIHYPIGEVDPTWASIPYGRPMAGQKFHILDDELNPMPIGVPGHLFIGGVGVAQGYWRRPDLTADRFIPDPFTRGPRAHLYRTGDLGRYGADGVIEFLGRADHQVKLRGFRIELGEIEATLASHPEVRQAVAAVKLLRGERCLVAYVVPARAEDSAWVDLLLAYLRERLPPYMVPAQIIVLASLPLSTNGKVDRAALPEPSMDAAVARLAPSDAPSNELENVLAGAWASALGLPSVGRHDNFFELGGDSIRALDVVGRLRKAGYDLQVRHIFVHQTVAALAPEMKHGLVEPRTDSAKGQGWLTPAQAWFFELGLNNHHRFNMSVLLQGREPICPLRLRASLQSLIERHPALSNRFTRAVGGVRWVRSPGERIVEMDIVDVPPRGSIEAMRQAAEAAHRSLDVERGPLFRTVLLKDAEGRSDTVLLVAHHLVTDGVSWRVLLADLEEVYQAGRGPTPPAAPSHGVDTWLGAALDAAASSPVLRQRRFWVEAAHTESSELPLHRDLAFSGGRAGRRALHLAQPATEALSADARRRYGATLEDVLLTVLGRALRAWTKGSCFRLTLERHGREGAVASDHAQTVGWFTAMFPWPLRVGADEDDIQGDLLMVKEQIRRIPDDGTGYSLLRYLSDDPDVRTALSAFPSPQLAFNFFGRFEAGPGRADGFFRVIETPEELLGLHMDPLDAPPHPVTVNAAVTDGRLEVVLLYDRAALDDRDAADLVDHLEVQMAQMCEHFAGRGGRVFSPSDFGAGEISQDDLAQILSDI